MLLVIAYLLFIAYAAGLFVYGVVRERSFAAIGILVSMAGLQFALFETIVPVVGIGIAAVGLVLIGRDLLDSISPRLALAVVQRRRDSAMPVQPQRIGNRLSEF